MVEVNQGMYAVHRVDVDTIVDAAFGSFSTSTYQETGEVGEGTLGENAAVCASQIERCLKGDTRPFDFQRWAIED